MRCKMKKSVLYIGVLFLAVFILHVFAQAQPDERLFQEAKILIFDKEWKKAQEKLEQIMDEHPDSPWFSQAVFYRAKCLKEQAGKERDALRAYQDYLKRKDRSSKLSEEAETDITPARHVKKVLVIGGGPAGMKAACTAAERGHQVTLAERDNELGGQLLLNRYIPGRKEMVTAATDLINNLRALNVNTLLGREVDQGLVREMKPDVVIVATGASPTLPHIPGIETQGVATAWDVLSGKVHVGERVVIVGGNAVGLETALYLADQGTLPPEVLHFLVANRAESWETLEELVNHGDKHVTVVEMMKRAGEDIGSSTRWTVMIELRRLGVSVLTGATAVGITPEGVEIEKGQKRDLLPADSVVIAAGAEPENLLVDEMVDLVPEIYTIGDAKAPRNALEAIKEGFLTGLRI